jgi:acyl-CoA synthetase (AMP-forming)/AMP-acid ligase II/acyl carrier protein
MDDNKADTIYALLRAQAKRAPGAAAIVAPGRGAVSYRALQGQVDGFARALHGRGVQHNDVVAIVLPNGPEMAVTFVGVAASAICAPLNPAYSRREFEFYLADLKPKVLIVRSGMNYSAAVAVAEERAIAIIELSPKPGATGGVLDLSDNEQETLSTFRLPQANDIALILHTSGTTSRPKMVPLTQANLIASAGNIAATLRLNEADLCLNVMPLFHIHGLVGALLSSLAAGGSVVCTAGFEIEQFLPWLKIFHPTWYTAVPTIHHAVLSCGQADPTALIGHSLRFIRSSSAALPTRVMQGLEESFQVPVIESYGMTEAAHQMASSPLPPGQRKIGSAGPAAGPEMSIMNDSGNLLPRGEIGEVVIRGANVMSGYGNSEANAEAFTGGWFRTGDQGYLDKDGYLFISGRLKEIINRGGEKISPREVDEVLLAHSSVEQAVTFGVRHPTLGEEVAAAVVLRPHAQTSMSELRQFVATTLADFKVPRQIVFVDTIPKGATGKVARNGLSVQLADQLKSASGPTRNGLQHAVAAIFGEVIAVEHVGATDDFFDLGGDSLRAFQVISRIRAMFDVNLSIATVFAKSTVAELADEIVRALGDRDGG